MRASGGIGRDRADGRTGGRADGWTGGRADERTGSGNLDGKIPRGTGPRFLGEPGPWKHLLLHYTVQTSPGHRRTPPDTAGHRGAPTRDKLESQGVRKNLGYSKDPFMQA